MNEDKDTSKFAEDTYWSSPNARRLYRWGLLIGFTAGFAIGITIMTTAI